MYGYQSDRNQHFTKVHAKVKKWAHCNKAETGRQCVLCGPTSKKYADNRSLKRHYTNGDIHKVEDLLEAEIDTWLLYEPGSKGDIATKAWKALAPDQSRRQGSASSERDRSNKQKGEAF